MTHQLGRDLSGPAREPLRPCPIYPPYFQRASGVKISRGKQSVQFHRSHVRSLQVTSLSLSRTLLHSNAMDQTIGSGQPCFSATWGTVNPFDKSVFRIIANAGIFSKCFDTVLCMAPNLLAILSWGIFIRCMRKILRSISNSVDALKSVI